MTPNTEAIKKSMAFPLRKPPLCSAICCPFLPPILTTPKNEERWTLLGQSQRHRLLVVVHTERQGTIRIISARRATTKEKKNYEEA